MYLYIVVISLLSCVIDPSWSLASGLNCSAVLYQLSG